MGSFPAEEFFCLGGIGPEGRQITIPAGTDHIRQLHIVGLIKGVHQFQNRDAVAGAQVDGFHTVVVLSVLQSLQVADCKVYYMEVVSLASAVGGVVVTAEDC